MNTVKFHKSIPMRWRISALLDGYAFESKAKQILKGFGFRESDFTRDCALFSGGWKCAFC